MPKSNNASRKRRPKPGRPTSHPDGKVTQVAIKITPPVYKFLEELGDGIPGRGLRLLAERAAGCESGKSEGQSATATPLMTADEFLRLHGDESGVELIKGRVVRLPMPGGIHGRVCYKASLILGGHIEANRLGRVFTNDTFVKIRHDPEECRGPDLAFISYAMQPESSPVPAGALTPPLELAVEVRSPSNTLNELTMKASLYIASGVKVVLVLDPPSASALVFRENEPPHRFHAGDEFTLTDILPGFAVPVKRFFE